MRQSVSSSPLIPRRAFGCGLFLVVGAVSLGCAGPEGGTEGEELALVAAVLPEVLPDAVVTSSAVSGELQARLPAFPPTLAALPGGALSAPLVHVGRGCPGDAYLGNPAGSIALIERSECFFGQKIGLAQLAGAVGAIVYDGPRATGDVLVTMSVGVLSPGVAGLQIPSVFVSRSSGLALAAATGPATATMRVLSPVGGLRAAIGILEAVGVLGGGEVRSLIAKLDRAERLIDDDRSPAARGVLEAFIREVRALVSSGRVAAADGDRLIAAAQALLASIGA